MKKLRLSTKILIGLTLGVLVGLLFQDNTTVVNVVKPLGDLFIRLIKMITIPLIFSTLIVGVASVNDVKKLGRMGGKTVVIFLITTAFAVIIGLFLGNLIAPGADLGLSPIDTYEAKQPQPIVNTFLNMVPTNPLAALVNGQILQVIFFALLIGISITLTGQKAEPAKEFFESFAEIMYKITGMVMKFAPIGVFGLIVPVVATYGSDVLLPLIKLIFAVYLGAIIHASVVYSLSVRFLGKMSPLQFFKGILPAQLVAFSTCSSSGTLPITIRSVRENLGVSNEVASFVLPLGATINMDGNSLYQGICALFVAQAYGVDLSVGQQLMVVLTGTLASIGAAGIPGAGLIVLTMVLSSVGLPIEGVALVAGIDRILDMARTTLNISGDAAASVIVAVTEGEMKSSDECIENEHISC